MSPTTPGPPDWQEVRRRLERAAQKVKGGERLSPEQARAVLDERARRLAAVPPEPPRPGETFEVLVFRAGKERHALPTQHVVEVARPGEHTPVPGAPPVLVGVVNLRGEILPVFDAATLLDAAGGEGESRDDDRARLLVLGGDGLPRLALLVDEVCEVGSVRQDEVHEPSAGGLLRGVTGSALAVLDGAALFEDERLFIDMSDETGA